MMEISANFVKKIGLSNINLALLFAQPLGLDCLPVPTADRPNPSCFESRSIGARTAGFANPAGAEAGTANLQHYFSILLK
jgi:hypothetical protein